nr:hypothetical protein [Tanacetum cinerariifolium]
CLPIRQGTDPAGRATQRRPSEPGGLGPWTGDPRRQTSGDLRGIQTPGQPSNARRKRAWPGAGNR